MKDTLKDKEQPLETKTEEEKESQPNLSDLTKELEELRAFGTVKYGLFLAALINFLIVAFVLFLVIIS